MPQRQPHPHRCSKPELLAPAGSPECFHAALDAGADAVYLGLNDFNARLRAKNFSAQTLAYLVPYAHTRGVKVYVTLNTLVKQHELEPLVHTLHQLQQIGVDGLIVADFGAIEIAAAHFPRLTLHASTQLTIHNSAGVAMAAKLGLRRAVLARELTLEEITAIRRSSAIELEVFVHGALCYSISGACLASSFWGGLSGNRGRCTQVCRRKYDQAGRQGYFFSPRDLQAIESIPRYREIGIASLKIEGRMKSARYVRTVVAAYRRAIDTPESIPELLPRLEQDMGRSKTTFFLHGMQPAEPVMEPDNRSGTGIYLGPICAVEEDAIILISAVGISSGDTIRIQPADGYEGRAVRVRQVSRQGEALSLAVPEPTRFGLGDAVYLTESAEEDQTSAKPVQHTIKPVRFQEQYPYVERILKAYQPKRAANPSPTTELLITIDNPNWLQHLEATCCDGLILAGGYADLVAMLADERLAAWQGRISLSLPVFMPEASLDAWQSLAVVWSRRGVLGIVANNIGGLALADRIDGIRGGAMLACLNAAAAVGLRKLSVRSITRSYEDDFLNLRNAGLRDTYIHVYGFVPLFTSRIQPAAEEHTAIRDPLKREIKVVQRDGLYYTLGVEPLCLFQKIDKLREIGITRHIIDLSFHAPERAALGAILAHFRECKKLPGTTIVNFKSELK
jgi:putative protease